MTPNTELKTFLTNTPRSKWNTNVKRQQHWLKLLLEKYPNVDSLNEKLWLFYNNLSERPKCKVTDCNNTVNWLNNDHYSECCSGKCREQFKKQTGKLNDILQKTHATNLTRYGFKNPMSSSTLQEKRINTLIDKHGEKVSKKTKDAAKERAEQLQIKGRKTIKEKYNVDNVQQVKQFRQKTLDTFVKKYGVSNPSKIPDVKRKKSDNKLEKWNRAWSDITILSETVPFELREHYSHANMRIEFMCNTCGKITILPSETLKYRIRHVGTGCEVCGNISNNSSLAEQEIGKYIESVGFKIEKNTKELIPPKEIDIAIIEKNVAIEYCGLYWHRLSNRIDQKYHLTKLEACNRKNIRLVTIFEDEWIHTPDIVKLNLLHVLGVHKYTISASKCNIVKLENHVARTFCRQNHLQGACYADVSYALTYEDNVVSVMTFFKITKSKDYEPLNNIWKIERICFQQGVKIINGAVRIFSKFLKDFDPDVVIGYSDRRWETGNIYKSLGFNFAKFTDVNCWYIDYSKIKRRHTILPTYRLQNLTYEIDTIWDCGHDKWIWSKK